jgi:hypothetical protein
MYEQDWEDLFWREQKKLHIIDENLYFSYPVTQVQELPLRKTVFSRLEVFESM